MHSRDGRRGMMRAAVAARRAAMCAALAACMMAAATAHAATPPGAAVVLVSGFNTATPFTTSNPACTGREGVWSPPGGVAATLKGAGLAVFTAPVKNATRPVPAACSPDGPAPPVSDYIDSNGEVDANGRALGAFLQFLHTGYGIDSVQLVAHSDGGLWSRSAITQRSGFPGVGVVSLTTLGTPYTGSFAADLAEVVANGRCHAPNRVEQLVCDAFVGIVRLTVARLGETAVSQLTNGFLATWNPDQSIGRCPVTAIAGTYFHLPLPRSLVPAYYNPADGWVGEASALGQASRSFGGTAIPAPGIPQLAVGGTFPVVHSTFFSFITPKNLLDQAAISQAVASTLSGQSRSGPPCNSASASRDGARRASAPAGGSHAVSAPLYRFVARSRGRLPRPARGDLILASAGARLTCGAARLPSTALPGGRGLLVAFPSSCAHPVGVAGRAVRALLVEPAGVVALVFGRAGALRVRVRGLRPRRVQAELELAGGRFRRIPLTGSGGGRLPARAGRATVRITVAGPTGEQRIAVVTASR